MKTITILGLIAGGVTGCTVAEPTPMEMMEREGYFICLEDRSRNQPLRPVYQSESPNARSRACLDCGQRFDEHETCGHGFCPGRYPGRK